MFNPNPMNPISMPQAVPGAPDLSTTGAIAPPTLPPLGGSASLPTNALPGPVGAPPSSPVVGAGGLPPQGGSAPPVISPVGGQPMFPPVQVDPAQIKYSTETQSDGSVLIRIMGPDGTPGPVVEILRTPKPKGAKPVA